MRVLIKNGNAGQANHLVDETDKPCCKVQVNEAHWHIYDGPIGTLVICKRCLQIQERRQSLVKRL